MLQNQLYNLHNCHSQYRLIMSITIGQETVSEIQIQITHDLPVENNRIGFSSLRTLRICLFQYDLPNRFCSKSAT